MAEVWKKCGHPRTKENTRIIPSQPRGRCRTCYRNYERSWSREYRQRDKGVAGTRRHNNQKRASGYMEKHNSYYRPRKVVLNRQGKERAKLYEAETFADLPDRRVAAPSVKRPVILGDIHFPWEDGDALNEALEATFRIGPDCVILNGDIVDCYAGSKFLKDPRRFEDSIVQEHDRARKLMKILEGFEHKYWLGGNHEDRWRKILWNEGANTKHFFRWHEQAAGHPIMLGGPHEKSFANLFDMKEFGFKYYPYGHRLYLAQGNLIVTHGRFTSRHSAYAAKRTWEWLGNSCVVNHTHKGGKYLITQDGRDTGAWESYCLCIREPEHEDAPNWQHGFSFVNIEGPLFHVIQVPIVRRGKRPVAVYHSS